jgi:hypothetical protein
MIAKTLQAIGVLLSFGGLVGDDTLTQWEGRLRVAIRRTTNLSWARFLITWAHDLFNQLRTVSEKLLSVFVTVVIIIGGVVVMLVNSYNEGQVNLMLYEARKQDPVGYDRTQLYMLIFMVVIIGIVFLAQKLLDFIREQTSFFHRLFAGIGTLLRWLVTAYLILAEVIIFGGVAIVLAAIILLILLGGLILMAPLVAALILGFLIVRVILLPYQILDTLTIRLKLKSTILFVGLICELIGILID